MYLPTTAIVTSWSGCMTRCSSSRQSLMSSGSALQVQLLDDQLVELVVDQAERHLVDAELLVALLDDGPASRRCRTGRSCRVVLGADRRSVRQMRMSGWMPICRSCADECCVGLVFSSPAAFRYGTSVRWMYRQFSLADVEGELADRLQERQALDVADGAADLGDDDVDVVGRQLADGRLDLVGDVRDDLDGLAQVLALRAPSG